MVSVLAAIGMEIDSPQMIAKIHRLIHRLELDAVELSGDDLNSERCDCMLDICANKVKSGHWLLAVIDESGRVVGVAGFNTADDCNAAAQMFYTVLARLGEIDTAEIIEPPKYTFDEIVSIWSKEKEPNPRRHNRRNKKAANH